MKDPDHSLDNAAISPPDISDNVHTNQLDADLGLALKTFSSHLIEVTCPEFIQ